MVDRSGASEWRKQANNMAALRYLEMQRAAQPELAEWYSSMADLYERKLWHQLTQKLEQFVALTVFQVLRVFVGWRCFAWLIDCEREVGRCRFRVSCGIFLLWWCGVERVWGDHQGSIEYLVY